ADGANEQDQTYERKQLGALPLVSFRAVPLVSSGLFHPRLFLPKESSMTRDDAITLLKSGWDGVQKWNEWRKIGERPPDLSSSQLSLANLNSADLVGTN